MKKMKKYKKSFSTLVNVLQKKRLRSMPVQLFHWQFSRERLCWLPDTCSKQLPLRLGSAANILFDEPRVLLCNKWKSVALENLPSLKLGLNEKSLLVCCWLLLSSVNCRFLSTCGSKAVLKNHQREVLRVQLSLFQNHPPSPLVRTRSWSSQTLGTLNHVSVKTMSDSLHELKWSVNGCLCFVSMLKCDRLLAERLHNDCYFFIAFTFTKDISLFLKWQTITNSCCD